MTEITAAARRRLDLDHALLEMATHAGEAAGLLIPPPDNLADEAAGPEVAAAHATLAHAWATVALAAATRNLADRP